MTEATNQQPLASSPVALSIAGSDSGGGAGIQADLRAFAAFGVFGTTAITAITAQNPHGVTGIQAVAAELVASQIEAVLAAFAVAAVKTGMLFDAGIIAAVADCLTARPDLPLVVDPVMVATSGARLLHEDAVAALRQRLLPLGRLLTPNLPELELLTGRPVDSPAAARAAGLELARLTGTAVLVKGGHHQAATRAVDLLIADGKIWRLSSPVVAAPTTHGTGCSLSAAIAACLARGADLPSAVVQAKAYVLGALRAAVAVGPASWAMIPPATLPVDDIVCEEA